LPKRVDVLLVKNPTMGSDIASQPLAANNISETCLGLIYMKFFFFNFFICLIKNESYLPEQFQAKM
jgi:hypothetical protein